MDGKGQRDKNLVLLEAGSSLSLHDDSVAGTTLHHVLDSSVGITHGHLLDPGADTGLGGKFEHLLGDLPATNEGAGNGDMAHQKRTWGDSNGGDLGQGQEDQGSVVGNIVDELGPVGVLVVASQEQDVEAVAGGLTFFLVP